MIVSILSENRAGEKTGAEHGLSYLVEYDGKKVLFDTGQSNLFMKNAQIMGVDLKKVDVIVLSHGHYDHGNGLEYLEGGTLICHPGCFVKRYRKADFSYLGLKNTKEELYEKFEVIETAQPYKITDKFVFLGEIPRLTDFESKETPFVLEGGSPDFIMDDSAIALITEKGLFVITGCGHAGVVNTLEHAIKVTGEKRIYGIMGGFHLKNVDRQTLETVKYLKEKQTVHILPSHCTAGAALSLFYEKFGNANIKTGDVFNFSE